jgi:hypothetical protein
MKYLVMDTARTARVEVDAMSPRQAREKAKGQLQARGWIGELEVYEKEDPLKGNKPGTEEFFGARPPIIL